MSLSLTSILTFKSAGKEVSPVCTCQSSTGCVWECVISHAGRAPTSAEGIHPRPVGFVGYVNGVDIFAKCLQVFCVALNVSWKTGLYIDGLYLLILLKQLLSCE